MRRPVMYIAGLLLATGASLALAGPASASAACCGGWDPFGNTTVVDTRNIDYNSDVDVRSVDQRDISNVGLINLGTAQGDGSSASRNGLLGILGL